MILADYGLVIALYLGLALATLAAVFYWAARALGLGDLGKTVDLVERSVRRREGDRELAEACSAMRKGSGREYAPQMNSLTVDCPCRPSSSER